MADITLLAPQVSFFGSLNTASPNGLTNALQVIQDGLGRNTPLSLSLLGLDINTSMGTGFSIDNVGLTATATQINNVCASASFSAFTTALKLPAGTTGQRPGTPSNGDLRYNSTTQSGELYADGVWMTINAGNPSGYYPGAPTYIQDTYAAGTYNVSLGSPAQIMSSRTECTFFGDYVAQSNSTGSRLCAFGYQSLLLNSSASNNSAYGHSSGSSTTVGFNNSYFGKGSGNGNVSGYNNSFFGFESGFSSPGDDNSFYGASAGRNIISGDKNSFYGSNASASSSNISNCSAFGYGALYDNEQNICSAFGSLAAHSNVSGSLIDAFGFSALYSNILGNNNSAFSNNALFNNIDGDFNCAFGVESSYSNTAGDSISSYGHHSLRGNLTTGNSAFGSSAGYSNTTGTVDAFGYDALFSNTTGNSNSAFSRGALLANTSGSFNCAFGRDALSTQSNKSGSSAFGYNAAKNSTGNFVTAVGYNCLLNSTADFQSGFGYGALSSATTGSSCSAFGYNVLNANIGGSGNSGFGSFCLSTNVSGSLNSGYGYNSLLSCSSGSNNVGVGASSLSQLISGNYNVGVGYNAGSTLDTGDYNSFFGARTAPTNITSLTGCTLLGALSTIVDGLTNATAIGYQAAATTSNTIILGASGTNIGIGTSAPANPLHVVGSVQFKGISSGYTGTGLLRTQSGFSTAGTTPATLDFPLSTSAPNIVNVRVHISVINTTGDKSAYSSSIAAAFYNNGAVTASTGTLPTIIMTTTAAYAPTAAWSISGNNLRLTLTGVAASNEIWVVSVEQFSTFNTNT